jgi:hypothetical protein
MCKTDEAIRLSRDYWRQDFERLAVKREYPSMLIALFENLHAACFGTRPRLLATEEVLELAKEYLQVEIAIGKFTYAVVVDTPEGDTEDHRKYLVMVRIYPFRRLLPLKYF